MLDGNPLACPARQLAVFLLIEKGLLNRYRHNAGRNTINGYDLFSARRGNRIRRVVGGASEVHRELGPRQGERTYSCDVWWQP